MKNVSKVFKNVLCQLEITKYMARIDQLDNRLMKIEEQSQPTPSLDHAASRLVKSTQENIKFSGAHFHCLSRPHVV